MNFSVSKALAQLVAPHLTPQEEKPNDVPKFILSSHREMLNVRLQVIGGVSSPHTPSLHLEVKGGLCCLLSG